MRVSWDYVTDMTAVEFLNMICYIKDKAAEEQRQTEKWRRSH